MLPNRTTVVACATVLEEIAPILPEGTSCLELDFGLHLKPANLKQALQEAIDEAGKTADTVLLGYGLCSLAVVGLKANNCTLVVPKVDDCIAIFMGSRQAYSAQSGAEPGTYYLTKGWIEVSDTIWDEYQKLVERHGEPRAQRMMRLMLKNYTRLAYSEVLPDEKDPTCAGFLHRAMTWFATHGVRVRQLLTDNAMVYRRGTDWAQVCSDWQLTRRFTKPGCPWTNGKAERFNRTLLTEWAYARPWTSNSQRTRGLDQFLRRYNTQRGHSALGGKPPISRLAA